jgi:tRNA(fMet)-specific endonuclease VapC
LVKLHYMLDTNVCIHVMRRPDSPMAHLFKANSGALAISTVTLHELLHGVERSARPQYQRELTEDMVSRLALLDFDDTAATHSANIHATLAKAGRVIGVFDMLIAGHARSLGLTVVTSNIGEFTRVEGLRCEDWLAEGAA